MKRKLLLAALFVVSALGFNAKAQEGGTYYIQNVESGKWFVPYNNWGTRASVYEHADYWKFAKISDGVYNLESVVSNGGSNYYLNGDYCDGGASNIYFTPVEGKENVYNISTDQGTNYYTAADKLINRAQDPTALSAQWKLYTITDMANLLATATALDPIDATFLIKDHNLSRNNRDASAWKNSGATNPTTSGTVSESNSVFTVEAYKKTFNYSQTLTDIPNGIYALRVNCFYRQDGSDTNYPYLYAGTKDNKVTFPIRTGSENNMQQAAASFVAGKYLSDPVYVEVTDGTLLLGTATDGTSCWSIFKNFHLLYYGNVTMNEVKLADYVKIYNEAMDAAKAYQSVDMFDEDKTALNTAITTNTLDLSTATEESLTTATNNLKAAATAAEMAKKAYLEYSKIEQILTDGAGSATIDLTSILTNPGFETGNTEGWTNSGSITAGAQGNTAFDNKRGSYYAERWHTEGTVDINQTLHRLPAGIYKISAYVYSDTQDVSSDPYREFRKGIKITTFEEDSISSVSATLVANYAIFYEKRKLWEAKGNVVVEQSNGRKLYTSQLFWNQATHTIYSNVDSKVVDGDEVYNCEGFDSDETMSNWSYRKLKGVTYLEDSQLQQNDSATEQQ